jgi:RNA polymerase sigma factor (sigma-70 family)
MVNEAWGECYRRLHSRVWSCAVYVVRTIPWLTEPGEVAIDIASDVFANLPQIVRSYREIGKAESWLMQVAIRAALRKKASLTGMWSTHDAARDILRFDDITISQIASSLDRDVDDARIDLRLKMEEWSNDDERAPWVAFVNLFLEGYSHEDIAERLGITPGTSRTLLWKIRKDLGSHRMKGKSE